MARVFQRLCVFTGSSPGNLPTFASAARELADVFAADGIGLVYGGARIGLMGAIADALLEKGGLVHGIIPKGLAHKEVAHTGLTALELVDTMHTRKARMSELSDGFIAMPGGFGTFEELFEVITWAQLGLHHKPVGVLNVGGYYDLLQAFIAGGVERGFIPGAFAGQIVWESSPRALVQAMRDVVIAPKRPWLAPSES